MSHAFDSKALELSRKTMGLMYGPMPVGGSCQLQAQIQNLFIEAMEFAAPAVQAEQQEPVSQPYTLREGLAAIRNLGPIDAEKIQAERDSLNEPDVPDGYALVPIRLTAENGAKGLLSGEFSETKFISCPECFGDDECETCDGSGRIEITVPVSWTTIKEIWAKGVEHFAAAPQQEAE